VTSVHGYEQDQVGEAEQVNDTYQYLDIKGKCRNLVKKICSTNRLKHNFVNTLHTGHADLRLYITTVQDG